MRMESLCSGEASGELVLVSVCLVPCPTSSKEYRAEHLHDCAIAASADRGMPWSWSADPGDTCSQQSKEGRVETTQITPSCHVRVMERQATNMQ